MCRWRASSCNDKNVVIDEDLDSAAHLRLLKDTIHQSASRAKLLFDSADANLGYIRI